LIGRATSDLHLTPKTAEWVFSALRELREDAEERGGFTVLVGDIFDQPKTVDMPTFNRLRDMVQAWPSSLTIIAGNHDQYDGKRNALEALAGGSCRVISEPTVTDIGLCVPYLPPSTFWQEIEGLTADVWWTHQGWRGSYLNNMRRDTDGLDCGRMTAKLCVSGHYHAPQNIGPIIYCGSPYQTTFAEEGQIKGWLAWDGELRPRRIPFEQVMAPRHWTVEWQHGEKPVIPEGYRDGDKVRIVTTASRDEVKKSKAIRQAGLSGASIVSRSNNAERVTISDEGSPFEKACEYTRRVFGTDAQRPDPESLREWAEQAALWG